MAQDQSEPMNYVLNGLSLPLMEIVDDLLERTEKLDPKEDRVLEDRDAGFIGNPPAPGDET